MTAATYLNGSWHCYELSGKRQRLIGCSHLSPRSAIAHTTGSYTSPLRFSGEASTADPVVPPSGVGSGLDASPEPRKRLTPTVTASQSRHTPVG